VSSDLAAPLTSAPVGTAPVGMTPIVAVRRPTTFLSRLVRNPSALIGTVVVGTIIAVALVSLVWTPYGPVTLSPHTLAGPSLAHLLGTDEYGRDVLSRLMAGARVSLYSGVFAVIVASLIGIPSGLAAAELGGLPSEGIMRAADLLFAFPALLAAVTLSAALGSSTTTAMLAIGIASVPYFARVTRSAALGVLTSEYVLAARAYGRGRLAIIRKHVLPNIAPIVLVQSSLLFSVAILAGAALSYLGLGTPPPSSAWGLMLEDAQHNFLATDPLLSLWPTLAIAITILGFNLLGNGMRDVLDPRLRVR
jgi:peptide/nickel transport system permease protein